MAKKKRGVLFRLQHLDTQEGNVSRPPTKGARVWGTLITTDCPVRELVSFRSFVTLFLPRFENLGRDPEGREKPRWICDCVFRVWVAVSKVLCCVCRLWAGPSRAATLLFRTMNPRPSRPRNTHSAVPTPLVQRHWMHKGSESSTTTTYLAYTPRKYIYIFICIYLRKLKYMKMHTKTKNLSRLSVFKKRKMLTVSV